MSGLNNAPQMDPRRQALLGMGAGILSSPYTSTPQSALQPFGAGLQQGLDAYNNAMILQQSRMEADAKRQAAENELKQEKQKQEAALKMLDSIKDPNLKAAMTMHIGVGDFEAAADLYAKQTTPTTDTQNTMANIDRLKQHGLWERLSKDQQAAVMGGAPVVPPPDPTWGIEYNPESGAFSIKQGVPGMSDSEDAGAQAQSLNETLGFEDVVGDIIFDPLFPKAVGPGSLVGRATGKDYLTDSPEYQLRQRLMMTIEPRVLALGGQVLKGSQTEKEWERVAETMPTVNDSDSVWRQWYKDFIEVEAKIKLEAGDITKRAYEDIRHKAGMRLSSQPMSQDEAEKWLKPGDTYIGLDGKKYRIEAY